MLCDMLFIQGWVEMVEAMSIEFVPQMSNQELAEAIAAVQQKIECTGSIYSHKEDLKAHHKLLLEAQAKRAVTFEIRESKWHNK